MGSSTSGNRKADPGSGGDLMPKKLALELLTKTNRGRPVVEGPSGEEDGSHTLFIRRDVALEVIRDAYRRGGNAARGLRVPHAQEMERQLVELKQKRLEACRLLRVALMELEGANYQAVKKVEKAFDLLDAWLGDQRSAAGVVGDGK